ncbi:biotin synthase BioB [Staphylococcus haemolyticus]|uniref:Biotin synthase n=2 Tax=Staphylococcus haemolyticus TaxID=1283 RepID=BIOB_STAHJ|nr:MULTISPECIES: biotin synthase BioB [Staphylococcus]Q4L9U7.1 RecName: Full=Biotin synthase [Staphylococcus haemolyticus JCSC1435]AVH46306.1 biotin synthase [Staphylococcus haemolyticus]AYX84167.1 biotin synthase [Staphylococcus haemolyticus]MBW5898889.1 biotin synthase BioB [Staphylococcus haemolyticus]MBW5903491.1 biotin synthase BioB [Staphylococcus haemolyticus]MBW5903639.1 biotin synthase BioB [Staphylococcus haemolyticus]
MRFNLAERILNQDVLSKDEALALFEDETIDTFELLNEAYIIRKHFFGKKVKLNMILNAKSGICSEDCGYCGQSVKMKEKQRYALVEPDKIKAGAQVATENHIGTYCIVMSGRGPTNREVDHICETVHDIKVLHPQLKICACLGLTNEEQAEKLKEAGVDRYNHNLNTSERYHNEVVTTHTYEDRVRTVEIMKANHISPCSGVICGMGETNEDIIDMAFALREIDADSIPINFLHPIKGTKFGGLDLLSPMKCLRIIAMFRLINPSKEIRIAGGREVNLRSLQAIALKAANSIFVGDYLITGGQPNELDYQMIEDLGFEIDG